METERYYDRIDLRHEVPQHEYQVFNYDQLEMSQDEHINVCHLPAVSKSVDMINEVHCFGAAL